MRFFSKINWPAIGILILACLVLWIVGSQVKSANAATTTPYNVAMQFGAQYAHLGPTDYSFTNETLVYDGSIWNKASSHGRLVISDAAVELQLAKGQKFSSGTAGYVNPEGSHPRPHYYSWDGRKPARRNRWLVTAKGNKHLLVLVYVNVHAYERGRPVAPPPK